MTLSFSEYLLYLHNVYMPLRLPLLFATTIQFFVFLSWNRVPIKEFHQYVMKFITALAKTVFAFVFVVLITEKFRVGSVAVMLLAIYIFMRFLRYLGFVYIVHKRFRLWFFLMSLYVVSKYTLHAILTNEWFVMVTSRIFLIIQFVVGLCIGEGAMLRLGSFGSTLVSTDPYFVFYCIALFIFLNEQFYITDQLESSEVNL